MDKAFRELHWANLCGLPQKIITPFEASGSWLSCHLGLQCPLLDPLFPRSPCVFYSSGVCGLVASNERVYES